MAKRTIARVALCILAGAGCGTLIMGHASIGVGLVILGVLFEYTARVET